MNNSENSRRFFLKKSMVGTAMLATTNPFKLEAKDFPFEGTGKNYTRLTNFNDYEGGKASNPVVSTDGKYMSFQFANTADPAGVGYGILLYTFRK